jgi:hypothetical protein
LPLQSLNSEKSAPLKAIPSDEQDYRTIILKESIKNKFSQGSGIPIITSGKLLMMFAWNIENDGL